MLQKSLLAIIAGTMLWIVLPAWGESASALLEKGVYEEETVGDLDGAIQAYGQIVTDGQAGAKFKAQAQFRLGHCQLKKRNKVAAAEAFKRAAGLAGFAGESELCEKVARELYKLKSVAVGPPAILCTSPPALTDYVSPSLKKITVTFDKRMMDQSWSWTGGGETLPKFAGKPRYGVRKMTCSLPVQLEPGKVYHIGINSASHKNFKTPDRQPAQWYSILFATQDVSGKPTPIPNDIRAQVIGRNWTEPVVVHTNPVPLSRDVDPSLDKITVRFDRPMLDKSWSWTGGGDTYPELAGKPHYDEGKTSCTAPVKLEPGKVYWVGINSRSHKNFKSADKVAAPWYVILFATKNADGKQTLIPKDMQDKAMRINAYAPVMCIPAQARDQAGEEK